MFEENKYTENQSQSASDSSDAANTEKVNERNIVENSSAMGTSSTNAGSSGNNNANASENNQAAGSFGNSASAGSAQSNSGYGNQNSSWQNGSAYNNRQYGNGSQYGSNGQYGSSQYGNTGQYSSGQYGSNPYRNNQSAGGQNVNNQNNYGYGQYQSHQGNYQYGTGDYGRNASGNYSGNQNMNQKPGKEKKAKKPVSAFWKKAIAMVLSGVCFGVFAGVSFLAVSSLGGEKDVIPAQNTAVVNEQTADSSTASEPEIKTTMVQGATTAVVTDVTDVVEATMPSIVSITNQTITSVADFWGQTYEREESSAGSGIIIGQNETELLIVTNNHVIDGSDKLSIKFIDDEVVEAQVKGTDSSMDLAVVAVKLGDITESTMQNISIAAMGDSDELKVGEPVIAIGNALGYGQSVTTGVVSALNRTLEISETGTSNALIQTDAAINPGNSGGALLDINGNVIGINSNKMGGSAIEGMGYAIPISSAQPIIEDLMNRETRERVEAENRGYLGISCINVNASMAEAYGMPEGILIAQVYPGTGADNAGLVKGDVIVGFGGASVTTQDNLLSAMEYYAIGDTVEITIMRGNLTEGYQEMKVMVTLTSQEAMNATNQ